MDPREMRAPTGLHADRSLERADLLDDPIEQFGDWLSEAEGTGILLANAMTLATADADGRPSARHVLLRGIDQRGFAFYTNHDSRKGHQLAENPHAALAFLWKELDRHVISSGRVGRIGDEESDAYFATRPREAQLGAWASVQSAPIAGREALDVRLAEASERFEGADVPRPRWWGGYRLLPDEIEFWQGREHRLHDRFRYTREDVGSAWLVERLSP